MTYLDAFLLSIIVSIPTSFVFQYTMWNHRRKENAALRKQVEALELALLLSRADNERLNKGIEQAAIMTAKAVKQTHDILYLHRN